MNDSNKKELKVILDSLSEYYQRDNLTPVAMLLYYNSLQRFTIEQVQQAVSLHMQDTKQGQFYPKVADIVKHLEGKELTTDGVIAAARLKNTPLGILCRIQIGTLSLNSGDSFHLKQKAEECLQLLPEWKARALNGSYTDHELSIMIKHDVDPCQPFTIGLAQPVSTLELRLRLEAIKDTPRHKYLLEEPYTGDNDNMSNVWNKPFPKPDNKRAVADYIAIEMAKEEK